MGTRIVRQLSTTFYPNPLVIFDELISNAHDALADTVTIRLVPNSNELNAIEIADNGEGMSHEGLVHFFYIAHTTKNEVRVRRSFKGIKRAIIGRFGIGKISLYQVCKRFNIVTWHDGVESSATFDFTEFERNEFIDSFKLHVTSLPIEDKRHGTRITLLDLKEDSLVGLTDENVAKRLSKTMPLSPGFKIVIEDGDIKPLVVRSEDIGGERIANVYPIESEVKEVGEVKGTVIFFKHEETKEEGVFIRVLGRLVNFDNPKGVLNLNSISHPRQFANKIRVEVNADGLNEALLTNRAGFMETHPAYIAFTDWLRTEIGRVGEKEYREWQAIRESIEKLEVPIAISEAYSLAAESINDIISKEVRIKKPQQLLSIVMKGRLKIEIRDYPDEQAEAFFDKERGIVVVNSANPSYMFSRAHSKLPGISYHIFKSIAVLIAIESGRDIKSFKAIYDGISDNVEILQSIRDGLRRK